MKSLGMLVVLLLVSCSAELSATSPETACTTDKDCRCRNFDGTQFLPGTSSGVGLCCTEEMIGTSRACNPETAKVNHCGNCVYE